MQSQWCCHTSSAYLDPISLHADADERAIGKGYWVYPSAAEPWKSALSDSSKSSRKKRQVYMRHANFESWIKHGEPRSSGSIYSRNNVSNRYEPWHILVCYTQHIAMQRREAEAKHRTVACKVHGKLNLDLVTPVSVQQEIRSWLQSEAYYNEVQQNHFACPTGKSCLQCLLVCNQFHALWKEGKQSISCSVS